MKKLIALLMAILMVATMMTTAMADGETGDTTTQSVYTPICPEGNNETQFSHVLSLKNGYTSIPEGVEIAYNFVVSESATIMAPAGVVNQTEAVSGYPEITEIKYDSKSVFTDGSCKLPLDIDWSGVSIKEPGIYVWTVTKSVTDNDPVDSATNDQNTFYLFVSATDTGSSLSCTMGIAKDAALNSKGNPEESYPSTSVELTITKEVAGAQASRNQYFAFDIALKAPDHFGTQEYKIGGVEGKVPESAYNTDEFTYPTTVTLVGGTEVTATVWLKHGQTATITGLPYGTEYSIVERVPAGYSAEVSVNDTNNTAKISGDSEDATKGMFSIAEKLTENQDVKYKNTKETITPTGIDLQTSAPIFGLLMAMAMMFMAFAGKRKEQMN